MDVFDTIFVANLHAHVNHIPLIIIIKQISAYFVNLVAHLLPK